MSNRACFSISATCLAILAVATPTIGAEPELITDRPDQTESSMTVPPGYVQLETGWSIGREDEDGVRVETSEIPATLVRLGLLEHVELRVGWAGFVSEEITQPGPDAEAEGVGDAGLGVKLFLREEDGRAPRTALLVGLSLPTGANEVSSDRADPSFRLSASHTLSDRLSVGYNAGMAWETEESSPGNRNTLSQYVYTAVLGIGLSERLATYVELFGEIPASADGAPRNSVDSGVTYLLRDNLQLDGFVGLGLSDEADDWFVGGGLSVRFPD